MKIVTASIMKELERKLFEEVGVPSLIVMEQAIEGVIKAIRKYYPIESTQDIVVLCGTGNNGGDGLGVARRLYLLGYRVEVIVIGATSRFKEEAKTQWKIVQNLKINTTEICDGDNISVVEEKINSCQVVIDAILGIGGERILSPLLQEIIFCVNHHKSSKGYEVVSVDIPSGVHCDSGAILGIGIMADITVTMGLPKLGLFLYPGKKNVGNLIICDIGLPVKLIKDQSICYEWLQRDEIARLLPRRVQPSHKGSYGRSVIIGGFNGMVGALRLSTLAAFRVGSGYVFGISDKIGTMALMNSSPEVIGELYSESSVVDRINRNYVVGIGPGLGQSEETNSILQRVYKEAVGPLVIDADGLNLISKWDCEALNREEPTIITPHPLEMSRLIGVSVEKIVEDPIRYGKEASKKYNAITVLKVYPTVITTPKGEVYLSTSGNPGMSTAGAGDVLTGMIVGWLAQGVEPLQAVLLSVFLHGDSGDFMKNKVGEHSLMASDIIDGLGQCICQIMHKF